MSPWVGAGFVFFSCRPGRGMYNSLMEENQIQSPSGLLNCGKLWGAAVLMIGGLGLIFLGGCFTVGIMIMTDALSHVQWTRGMYTLYTIVYVMAFACFLGGTPLIYLAARRVLRQPRD